MPPEVVETIGAFLAMIGLGSIVLIGMKMRYNFLQRTRGRSQQIETEQLADAVEALRDEVRLLREECHELGERVDFAERILTRARADQLPPHAE